jgi:hypothetical protein
MVGASSGLDGEMKIGVIGSEGELMAKEGSMHGGKRAV